MEELEGEEREHTKFGKAMSNKAATSPLVRRILTYFSLGF